MSTLITLFVDLGGGLNMNRDARDRDPPSSKLVNFSQKTNNLQNNKHNSCIVNFFDPRLVDMKNIFVKRKNK